MNIIDKEIRIPGLKSEFRFLQITDTHIILPDYESPLEKQEKYKRREDILFVRKGTRPSEKLSEFLDFCSNNKVFPVFSGDILDIPSKRNIEFFKRELNKVPDYFFVLGNHEWSYMDHYQGLMDEEDYRNEESYRRYHHLFDQFIPGVVGDLDACYKDMGDFLFVGFDPGEWNYDDKHVRFLEKAIAVGKPIIIVSHVPFYEKEMQPAMDAFAPGYLKRVCFGQELMPMNEATKRMKEMIVDPKNRVAAYICGHIHCSADCRIGGIVPQFALGGSYEGDVNLFTLKPEEK